MGVNNFFFKLLAILSFVFGAMLYVGYLVLKLTEIDNSGMIVYRVLVFVSFVVSLSAIIFFIGMLIYFLYKRIKYDRYFLWLIILGASLWITGVF